MSFLSSVTGLKATAFFLRPITQAESGALAKTRPVDTGMCCSHPQGLAEARSAEPPPYVPLR